MARVAFYYRKQDGAPAARLLPYGFACTRAELPGEIATICRADRSRPVEWTDTGTAEHSQILLDDAKARGLVIEPVWRSADYE
jgi:hypothetical protein